MEALIFYSIMCAALFYLGSRAMITRRLWLAYPPSVARFADCPACIGTWWGAGLAIGVGRQFDIDVFWFPASHWITPIVVGFSMMVLTPMAAALMQFALDVVGHTVEPAIMAAVEPVSPSE